MKKYSILFSHCPVHIIKDLPGARKQIHFDQKNFFGQLLFANFQKEYSFLKSLWFFENENFGCTQCTVCDACTLHTVEVANFFGIELVKNTWSTEMCTTQVVKITKKC